MTKGENSKCCGVQSKRGVYRFRRLGRVYGERGENIHIFKWGPIPDTNIGFNLGDLPHVDCRAGDLINDLNLYTIGLRVEARARI